MNFCVLLQFNGRARPGGHIFVGRRDRFRHAIDGTFGFFRGRDPAVLGGASRRVMMSGFVTIRDMKRATVSVTTCGVIFLLRGGTHLGMPNSLPDSNLKEAVGRRLAAARLALGKTQEQLANEIGVERNTYANWEGGSRLAQVQAMLRLMAAHRITLEWIYAGGLHGMPSDLQRNVFAAASRLGIGVGDSVAPVGGGGGIGGGNEKRGASRSGSLHEPRPRPLAGMPK